MAQPTGMETGMKRENQVSRGMPPASSATSTTLPMRQMPVTLREWGKECPRGSEVRRRQPRVRSMREPSGNCHRPPRPTHGLLRRTIRRELRQIVPLAGFGRSTKLERKGQRFFLTARCVVWDLSEVEAWLKSRRQTEIKKAPVPDYRQRKKKPGQETCGALVPQTTCRT